MSKKSLIKCLQEIIGLFDVIAVQGNILGGLGPGAVKIHNIDGTWRQSIGNRNPLS